MKRITVLLTSIGLFALNFWVIVAVSEQSRPCDRRYTPDWGIAFINKTISDHTFEFDDEGISAWQLSLLSTPSKFLFDLTRV